MLLLCFLLFFELLSPAVAFPSSEGGGVSVEAESEAAQKRLKEFEKGLSLAERKLLNGTPPFQKEHLNPSSRRLYDERRRLKEEAAYWDNIVRLKRDILNLPVNPAEPLNQNRRTAEADQIARMAIDGFRELRKEYEMIRPALFHNLLVNMKIKKEGLCWHWARDMIIRLKKLDLKEYDLHWASAREGTIREHNTVVVSSRGMSLEEGLFLDGWKNSGKPFWMRVKEDKKHPWKPGRPYGVEM
jgi:hypothetical protein